MKNRYLVSLVVILLAVTFVSVASARRKSKTPEPVTIKTIAIGDVDAGNDVNGRKAVDVKETIQILMKRGLEKEGRGRFQINIVSPAVVVEGSEPAAANIPALPTNRAPTEQELAKYMGAMQQYQKQMSGQVRVHKPVAADAYVDFSVSSGKGGMDTGGLASTIGQFTNVPTSIGNVGTSSVKVNLVCTLRDPASGTLVDRYVAKASSVKVKNVAGYTSYDYGNDVATIERLFNSSVKKCAKWVSSQVR